ncbi:hypothetical protein COO60DRAFT_396536 [Scenedesmus sp. NREL 46B-D3]|nr:hypothetical protein COO60DRAFT_396536 [Scenedesmus sp. NREL 46B-D3]
MHPCPAAGVWCRPSCASPRQYQLSGLSAAEQRRVKQQLVPGAVKVLQRYIKVLRPEGGVLRVNALYADGQQGCLISKVDARLASGSGGLRDTDLLLYVSSEAGSCLPGMIAMASACDVDPASRRPILGSLNVCGGALAGLAGLAAGSEAEAAAVGRLVEVLVHEVVHVLGFGSTHYEDWRGPDGKRYGERNVVKRVGGRPYLATPKVTAYARKFFGCDRLPGAPLENEGPSFSATSHFEYRLLQRELMGPARPIDRSRTRLSAFSLAALEDTGWYVADYSAAEVLDWGRGGGCAFVLQSCWDYMAANPGQPYFCGRGAMNQTRCTAEAAGWGVCRSSAFSDGCLLVGKYSQAGAAAVPAAGNTPSSEDGRQAACYSPPQLQRMQLMQRGSSSSSSSSGTRPPALLPLLGGSYSAARSDICYNLVQPQPHSSVVWVDGHGQIPEDVGRVPQGRAAGGGGGGSGGRLAGARAPGQQQQQQPQQRQQLRQRESARVNAYASYFYMDNTEAVQLQQGAAAAACVRVASPAAAPAAAPSASASAGRRLLGTVEQVFDGSSGSDKHGRQLSGVQAASSSALRASAAAQTSTASVQAALSAQGASLLASLANSSSSSSSSGSNTAACTASPVLCFSSNCDREGRLWIGASLPGGKHVSFACPSRAVVDLSRALPGSYLLGFLQCPSNALVCESMGCGQCSASGGYCSKGRCYCHMERYGKGCSQSLVPRLS